MTTECRGAGLTDRSGCAVHRGLEGPH